MAKKQSTSPPKESKSRWITFVLYPDNHYHMEYLEYIKQHNIGFYIRHEDNDEHETIAYVGVHNKALETKAHYHVAMYFPNPRTASGFVKSLPVVDYVVVGKKIKTVELFDFSKKAKVPYDTKTVEVPELSPNLSTYSLYYDEIASQYLVNSAQTVSDVYALAHYFIHDTIKCHLQGKRLYTVQDIQTLNNGIDVYMKFFEAESPVNTDIITQLIDIANNSNHNRRVFMDAVLQSGDTRLLTYIQSHSYFVEKFLIGGFNNSD